MPTSTNVPASESAEMLTPAEERSIARILEEKRALPGALLPVLHAVQDEFGYIPAAAIQLIADGLNISRADAHGVVTFYHHFRRARPGRHRIRLCRAESCQSMGAAALEKHVKNRLQIDFHAATADGRYSLEAVYCLGHCACSPAITIDDQPYGRVTPQRFDELLAAETGK